MCGRYTLKADRTQIARLFGLEDLPRFEPRYNLGPTQDGLVVRPGGEPGTRTAALLRWGLIPPWTREGHSGPLLINARGETAASKPAFRDAFRNRRCLVVADGFYEWTRTRTVRVPHHFTVRHGELFAMAGLWERWHPPGAEAGERLETFTILTTSANDLVTPHHDRMPVILDPTLYDDWLNPLVHDVEVVQRMLKPFPAMEMAVRRVSHRVNSVAHDDPGCLASAEDDTGREDDAPGSGQLGLDLG